MGTAPLKTGKTKPSPMMELGAFLSAPHVFGDAVAVAGSYRFTAYRLDGVHTCDIAELG